MYCYAVQIECMSVTFVCSHCVTAVEEQTPHMFVTVCMYIDMYIFA